MRLLCLSLAILTACTAAQEPSNVTVTVPVSSTLGASAGAEAEEDKEAREETLARLEDFQAVPLPKGKPAPENGVLFSPRQTAEAALDAAESDKLTVENKVLSGTRQQEIQLYENRIKELQNELVVAKRRTFWEQHGAVISGVVGAIVAAGFSLGIFKAATTIKEN